MTKMANPRSPASVLADLAEAERMIRECRARYTHAYDMAYSAGSGAAGSGRSDIAYSRPTEAAALSPGKDGTRAQVARAGREATRLVKSAHEMHAALVKAMPGADPYEQVWKPGPDGIATRAEQALTRQRQAERTARGEL